MEIIKTVCARDCPDTCFIDVTVDQGRIIKSKGCPDHPVTRGFLCPRGNADLKRTYSENRVLFPSLRNRRGTFEKIGWDKALTRAADKIRLAIDKYGNDALLLYDYAGNQGFLSWHLPRRLWMALGASITDYSLCSSSGHTGIGLHYGSSYSLGLEELLRSKVIVFWGNNAKVSAPHQWALADKSRKNHGAVIVCIDPRKSATAQASDIWIQTAPGSDVALSYGIAAYLIKNNGVDKTFLERWSTGFDDYAQEALKWPIDRVRDVTRVPEETIENFGNILIQHTGAAAFMIGLGLQKSSYGAQAARAVSLLPALLGQHRGFHYSDGKGRQIDWDYINGKHQASDIKRKTVSQVSIGKRLKNGEFKFIFVLGSNPAATLPEVSSVREGLAREDVFVVVHDTHWSETAVLADLVLPAPTYLEKRDIVISDHYPYSRMSEKAIDPLGESRHEIQVMQDLAGKLKRTETWLFEDPWHALGVALDRTFKKGHVKDLLDGAQLEVKLAAAEQYQTSSGKIEFWSTAAADLGYHPLPVQEACRLLNNEYILLNNAVSKYTHSQFVDVYGPIQEIVWISPSDAAKHAIQDGEHIEIFNELGCVCLSAKITDKVPEGVLWVPRPLTGLNGQPLNCLTPGTTQQIGGGPVFNSIKVKLRKE